MDINPIAEITSADVAGRGVTYLPDVPDNLTASQLKAKFEEITKEVVIPKINEIAGAVNRNTENKAEVDEIPAVPEWAMQPEKPQYSASEVGALAENSLPDAINSALAQAKASGEFDGEKGGDGFSPTVTIVDITGGHRIIITDANGTKYFDVMNGTGSSGGGVDGFSPVITVANIAGGHRVSITDANGTQTFDVMDGAAGYAPVKGKDYFTEADKAEFINNIFPVGFMYISTASTSPASMFGGTWEQVEDVFLLAAGSNYEAGSTGGAETHTLTEDEMPSHKHTLASFVSYKGGNSNNASSQAASGTGAFFVKDAGTAITATGGSQAHNNMPPYLAVYMWKRIA